LHGRPEDRGLRRQPREDGPSSCPGDCWAHRGALFAHDSSGLDQRVRNWRPSAGRSAARGRASVRGRPRRPQARSAHTSQRRPHAAAFEARRDLRTPCVVLSVASAARRTVVCGLSSGPRARRATSGAVTRRQRLDHCESAVRGRWRLAEPSSTNPSTSAALPPRPRPAGRTPRAGAVSGRREAAFRKSGMVGEIRMRCLLKRTRFQRG